MFQKLKELLYYIGRIKRRLINLMILAGGFAFFSMGVTQCTQIFDKFDRLRPHYGVVEAEWMDTIYGEDKFDVYTKIRLVENDTVFTAYRFASGVSNLLEPGDSVEIFTKPVTSFMGNMSGSGKGGMKNTRDPFEIFHMTSPKYTDPIINYEDHQEDMKNSFWFWFLFSFIFFGWFFYRRSGRKSAMVFESVDYS
jgi:hypothetical protein